MWRFLFLLTNPFVSLGLVFYVLGRTSGWFALATKFPQLAEYKGDWENFQSLTVQGIAFNRCVSIGMNADSLYLRPIFPFNLIYAPLEIPWSCITSAKRSDLLWKKTIQLRIDDPKVLITLGEENMRRARPYLPLDAV